MSKSWFIGLICVVTLVTGHIAISLNDPQELGPDSTGYINYAVNIASNGIYSNYPNPTEDDFFREPGYPYFLAGLYKVYGIFGEFDYISGYNLETYRLDSYRADLQFLRYGQLLLMILTIVMFYGFLKLISNLQLARYTVILCGVYYPLVVWSAALIREPLLLFLFTAYAYGYAAYYTNKKLGYLSLAAFAAALSALTFQVMIVFLPITLLMILASPKKNGLLIRLRDAGALLLLFIACISPWLYKVYDYYPDIRIAKTLGSSLTHESTKYVASIRRAERQGIIDAQELSRLEHEDWYLLSSKEIFDKSFKGWYLQEASRWNSMSVAEPRRSSRLKKYYRYFTLNWVKHNWSPLTLKEAKSSPYYLMMLPFLISITLGVISAIGMAVYTIKDFKYPVLLYLLFLFGVLEKFGSERRRSLPLLPMILFFFIYLAYSLRIGIKNRNKVLA